MAEAILVIERPTLWQAREPEWRFVDPQAQVVIGQCLQGKPDVGNEEFAAMKPAREEEVARLGTSERHGESRLDGRTLDLAGGPIDP